MNNELIILRVRELVSDSGLSDGKFADKIKMDRSGFSKRMTGLVAAGEGFINRIVLELGVSKQWLMLGIGEKYVQKNDEINTRKDYNFIHVPIVPANTHDEYLKLYKNKDFIKTLYSIPEKVDMTFEGNYRVFQVAGDAMVDDTYNSILSNDLVLGREVNVNVIDLHSESMYGRLFMVVYKDGVVLRKFLSFDISSKTAIFAALNPLYKDVALDLKSILELYNITKLVDREV